MERGYLGLRRLLLLQQAWARFSLLPLSALHFAVWFVHSRDGNALANIAGIFLGCFWIIAVFAVLNTARNRMERSLAFVFPLIPLSDLASCAKPLLAGGAGAEDLLFLLFQLPVAAAAFVAALLTYLGRDTISGARYWFRFVCVHYVVCCSLIYLWSRGRAERYPITFGPVGSAVATELALVSACFCLEFHERIFPRALQRTPYCQLAEIDGGELLSPVLKASHRPNPQTLALPSTTLSSTLIPAQTHAHTPSLSRAHTHARQLPTPRRTASRRGTWRKPLGSPPASVPPGAPSTASEEVLPHHVDMPHCADHQVPGYDLEQAALQLVHLGQGRPGQPPRLLLRPLTSGGLSPANQQAGAWAHSAGGTSTCVASAVGGDGRLSQAACASCAAAGVVEVAPAGSGVCAGFAPTLGCSVSDDIAASGTLREGDGLGRQRRGEATEQSAEQSAAASEHAFVGHKRSRAATVVADAGASGGRIFGFLLEPLRWVCAVPHQQPGSSSQGWSGSSLLPAAAEAAHGPTGSLGHMAPVAPYFASDVAQSNVMMPTPRGSMPTPEEALQVARHRIQTAESDIEARRIIRTLALALGAVRTEAGTIKALHAVLLQLVRPGLSNEMACTSTGASMSNAAKWRRRVQRVQLGL